MKKLILFSIFLLTAFHASESFGQDSKPCLDVVQKSEHSHYYILKTDAVCQKKHEAMRHGVLNVTGSAAGDEEIANWTRYVTDEAQFKNSYLNNFNSNDAVNYLRALFTKESYAGIRAKAVGNAYLDVYGREPNKAEAFAYAKLMSEGKTWYANMLALEAIQMNKFPKERTQMIIRAYQNSMGKRVTSDELNHWLPRTEHYKLLVEANRGFLYTTDGSKDFENMINQLLLYKFGNQPPTWKQKLIADCRKNRWIYSEVK